MIGVKPHVLRYWETQFKMLRPKKGRGGARMYRKRDVEILFEVKQLLMNGLALIGSAEGEHLNLGELVDAVQAARIAAGCAGLGPEAE